MIKLGNKAKVVIAIAFVLSALILCAQLVMWAQ
jgi:hypothetical protein